MYDLYANCNEVYFIVQSQKKGNVLSGYIDNSIEHSEFFFVSFL